MTTIIRIKGVVLAVILSALAVFPLWGDEVLKGTVVAMREGAVKVAFSPGSLAVPGIGDRVTFRKIFQGIDIDGGSGTVSEVDGSTVWVDIDDGLPAVDMIAAIAATHEPTAVQHDAKASDDQMDEDELAAEPLAPVESIPTAQPAPPTPPAAAIPSWQRQEHWCFKDNKLGLLERAICSDPALIDKDIELNRLYQALGGSGNKRLKASQRNWVKGRATCRTVECLHVDYDVRLDELRRMLSGN